MADGADALALYFMSANNFFLHLLFHHSLKTGISQIEIPMKRRCWMKTIHRRRTKETMERLLTQLKSEPSGQILDFFGMSATDFEFLLSKLSPSIAKQDTKFRKAIPPKTRLAITFRYLATGDSFRNLHYIFRISNQLISKIVEEVCKALIVHLKDYLKLPANGQQWLDVENNFKDIFPHCIGAVDSKRVVLLSSDTDKVPNKSAFNIVLFTLVDRNYCFLFAEIGYQKHISDGGAFAASNLCKKMANNCLNLPDSCPFPSCSKDMPYVFLGDNALPLQHNIMKPFAGDHNQSSIEYHFNKNFYKARIVVENVFGILAIKFQVLQKPITLQPNKASNVVITCVLLHNFLRKSKNSTNSYIPNSYIDTVIKGKVIPGAWRQEYKRRGALRPLPPVTECTSLAPLQIRSDFADYIFTNINDK